VLAAGLHGLDSGDRLPTSTEEDPEGLPDDVKEARGIHQLPATLAEAADRLAASDVLREAMGEFLFETFVATRRGECAQYEGMDDDEMIRRLRWRY
jgi:glutamine synthetase